MDDAKMLANYFMIPFLPNASDLESSDPTHLINLHSVLETELEKNSNVSLNEFLKEMKKEVDSKIDEFASFSSSSSPDGLSNAPPSYNEQPMNHVVQSGGGIQEWSISDKLFPKSRNNRKRKWSQPTPTSVIPYSPWVSSAQ